MNTSYSSNYANSHYSLKSSSDIAPVELFGYLYDIPKTISADDIKQVFLDNFIECEV